MLRTIFRPSLQSRLLISAAMPLLAIALSVGIPPPARAQDAPKDKIRLACEAEAGGFKTVKGDLINMGAQYEKGKRETFETDFEADPGVFLPDTRMIVLVENVHNGKYINVGSTRLRVINDGSGELAGEFKLGQGGKPLPTNFPSVDVGTRIRVEIKGIIVLGCVLRVDTVINLVPVP